MIGTRSANSIRASGQRPHSKAVYMTAPRHVCRSTKKPLPRGGRPYMMANGQEAGIETLRAVIAHQARGHDWNSVREFHQGQRSATAFKGRIHDRTPTRLPKHQKALAERGPFIHDTECVARIRVNVPGARFYSIFTPAALTTSPHLTRWARV